MSQNTWSKAERWAPLAAGLTFAAMTVIVRYLPMTDLPMHEGMVGIMRHFDDPKYMPHGLYVRNYGHANQLFYFAALLFSYVVSTSKACEIVVALSQIGMFVGAARLADYLGRSRWSALLVTPLALGFTFYWGLVANLCGFAAFLLLLPTLDQGTKDPSLRATAKVCGALAILFFAHEAMLFCGAGIVGCWALLHPLGKKTLARLVPVLFSAVLAVAHQFWVKSLFVKGQPNLGTTYLSFMQRLTLLPNVLFGSHEVETRLLLFALAAMGVMLYAQWRERSPVKEAPANAFVRGQRFLLHHRFALVAFLHLVAYFVTPFTYQSATMIHERFLGPAWAIFIIIVAPRGPVPRVGRLLAAIVPIGVFLVSWPQFLDAHSSYTRLDAVIAKIPYNATVTQATVDRPKFGTRVYSASTGPARIVAERGGRSGLSLSFSPIAPIMIPPEYQWNEYNARIAYMGSQTLMPKHDLKHWEWVVAQSRDPAIREAFLIALGRDADFVMQEGEYMLFHSKYEIGPMLSPDDPAITGRQDNLLARVKALVTISN